MTARGPAPGPSMQQRVGTKACEDQAGLSCRSPAAQQPNPVEQKLVGHVVPTGVTRPNQEICLATDCLLQRLRRQIWRRSRVAFMRSQDGPSGAAPPVHLRSHVERLPTRPNGTTRSERQGDEGGQRPHCRCA